MLYNSSKSSSVYGKRKTANVGRDSMLFPFRFPRGGDGSDFLSSFRILITGGSSGLVETITDAVSIHSIKKAEYARRLAEGRLGHVSLMDHFKNVCFCCVILVPAHILLRPVGIPLLRSSLVPSKTSRNPWPDTLSSPIFSRSKTATTATSCWTAMAI